MLYMEHTSSNINEVIRAVLNSLFFFYKKILLTHTDKTKDIKTKKKSSLYTFR